MQKNSSAGTCIKKRQKPAIRLLPFLNRRGVLYLSKYVHQFWRGADRAVHGCFAGQVNIFQLVPVGFSILYGIINKLVGGTGAEGLPFA